MDAMKDFVLWCLDTVPAVMLQPPISAFVGLALLVVTIRVIRLMIHL